ncbi:MAG: hydroxyacylglutathione hydrolase [Rubricella sp.]
MPLELETIPCLSDNYAFLLRDTRTGTVALVDAPDADAIITAVERTGWSPDMILLTHHHWDHVDGVEKLREEYGSMVVGAQADAGRLPALDREVVPGDTISVGESTARILDVSGHTVGHIAYAFDGAGMVATADSLMALGCGRIFEGTPEMMWKSLSQFLDMPDDMQILSGHEYTEKNAAFALTIEPGNEALGKRAETIRQLRLLGRPTVPSTLGDEKATNPFLRAHLPEVKAAIGMEGASDADVFAEIRRRKDDF